MANHMKNVRWDDEYYDEVPTRNSKKNKKGYHDPARENARQKEIKRRKAEKAKRAFED